MDSEDIQDNNEKGFIGVFDSGLGGISVLKAILKELPNERYIYFGDSANAPYGTKEKEQIVELTEKNINMFIKMGAKAVVLACNTATSMAAKTLRHKYRELPIIGVEPAIKPAALENKGKKIVIMATPATVKGVQFVELAKRFKDCANLVPLACPGLMEFVERGEFESKNLYDYLQEKLESEIKKDLAAVVLGCTHYPFIKKAISNVAGKDVKIYDGSNGTARQLVRVLREKNLISKTGDSSLEILNSASEEFVKRAYMLLEKDI
ncbi:MAG: glutamate racemase [Eubacteriales bacterium]